MEGLHSLAEPVIIGSGALNVDYLFFVDELVFNGETFINDFKKSPGGSASNTISALSRWGVPSGVIGCIGNDDDGDLLIEHLRKWNVIQWIKRTDAHTGRAFIYVDKNGKRSSYVASGANLSLRIDMFPKRLPEGIKWVHCSSLVGEESFNTQMEWLTHLPERVKISLSPGMIYARKGFEGLRDILKKTTVLFLNIDELSILLEGKDRSLEDALRFLHQGGPEIIAVTSGKEGSYLSDGRNIHHLRSLASEVVDTTGAGDAFAAGVLLGLIEGEAIEKAHIRGAIGASIVVKGYGALSDIPARGELDLMVERKEIELEYLI